MKIKYIFLLMALAVVSCQKDDDTIGQQISSFPGLTDEVGKIEVETLFNQERCDVKITYPSAGLDKDYSDTFSTIGKLSNDDSKYTACVYSGSMAGDANSFVPSGNISIFLNPDTKSLQQQSEALSFGYDFSEYDGCALIAISDKQDVFVIDQFLEGDVIGTMNGLVKWMNSYVERENAVHNAVADGRPDAESLFSSFQGGYTYTFKMPDQEVAAVACSNKDYLNGEGSVDVTYKVTPMHAFDDQLGHGDYYAVTTTVSFNSEKMYKGRFTKMHGGVHVRICGSFARELGIKSYISDKDGKAIGIYPSEGTPKPSTTIGSSSYTRGMSWNLGASVTGGISNGKLYLTASVNGGVSFNNSVTRNVSDIDILLDQKDNVAYYTYKFNNLPEYQAGSISISDPPAVSVHTATLEHSYIIYLPDVKDYSKETHKINVVINKLNYGASRFYSTSADFKDFTWGLDKMQTSIDYKLGGLQIPLPNRIPTGKLKITHNEESLGKYVYEVIVNNIDKPEEVYEFNGSSYAKGDSFESFLPVGKYNVKLKVGNTPSTTVEMVSAMPVVIKRCDDTKLNSGADFEK